MSSKKIAEFAKSCGVSVETIRFYQREGLLPIPSLDRRNPEDNIRRYDDHDIKRLKFILAAKKAGLTLKEIKGNPPIYNRY